MFTVLDYLETAANTYPDQIAYENEESKVSFLQVSQKAKQIGSLLSVHTQPKQPVVVIAQKNVWTPSLYLGVAYSGCFYVPIGIDQPVERINTILNLVEAEIILTDGTCDDILNLLTFNGTILSLKDINGIDEDTIYARKGRILDTDPLYVIFTSGSTGVPKGIITSHRSVMDYIEIFVGTFSLNQNEVIGSQAAFDYIAAIRDIYIPLYTGARTVIVPKRMFSTPHILFEYLNFHKITMICWASSALALCCSVNAFDQITLPFVKKVFFTGSILSGKHLRAWQDNLPGAKFINHYGPTEITASCTYHIVEHLAEPDETLPIGIPFRNTEIILLGENHSPVPIGKIGEICVKGMRLAIGYYKDDVKTKEAFINNPLQPLYMERIYKTGDLGSLREDGILLFHGRADRQIKHMGYRVELDEIDAVVLSMHEIESACCMYDPRKECIWLFYTGAAEKKELATFLRTKLPGYMVPRKLEHVDILPRTHSGKLDMNILREKMI